MSNYNKSVHKTTGALGALIASGQLATIDDSSNATEYKKYITNSGIDFTEDEFIYVDPNECEPWEYANRHPDDFDGFEELKKSIQQDSQLQPALIREHQSPHDNIKYEVIFGRRRHQVCKELGIKMMAIRKRSLSLKEALKLQHTENEQRRNVSNYSNALIYKKLLDNDVYKSQRALAVALDLPPATINDIMYYTKLPHSILNKIGSAIHTTSTQLIRKLSILCDESQENQKLISYIADKLGSKITTPVQLTSELSKLKNAGKNDEKYNCLALLDSDNIKILELKLDFHGNFKINLSKNKINENNYQDFVEYIKGYFVNSKIIVK